MRTPIELSLVSAPVISLYSKFFNLYTSSNNEDEYQFLPSSLNFNWGLAFTKSKNIFGFFRIVVVPTHEIELPADGGEKTGVG